MLTLEAFKESIKEVQVDTKYYFIRTQHGEYFETFYENSFVAYGYNQLTIDDLRNKSHDELRVKVSNLLNISDESSSGKRAISSVINKTSQFINLKQGDIVVIPSANSDRFAIGVIDKHSLFSVISEKHNCPYYKRQKVKWLRQEARSKLPPMFQSIRAHHGISELNSDFHKHIDSSIHGIYSKGDNTYLVLDVNIENEIKLEELHDLIKIVKEVADISAQAEGNLGDPTIQITLNSPGRLIIKTLRGTAAAYLAFTLVTSCKTEAEEVSSYQVLEQIDLEKRESIRQIFSNTHTTIRKDTLNQ